MSLRHIDLLIKGGTVYDGTGSLPFKADIQVKGNAIAFIGESKSAQCKNIIDARGLSIAPGFIDAHGHSEFTLLADPRAEGHVSQGITTEINGNCGLSGGPLLGDALEQRQADLKEFSIKKRWASLGEYLGILDSRGLSINFATLAGHGNIRASIMGYKDKKPSAKEMTAMKGLLRSCIREGALGLSTGLIYPPGIYSDTQELIGLMQSITPQKSGSLTPVYASHMRSEGERLLEAIEEAIEIGRASRCHVHISHIKTAGKKNWHKIDAAISLMEDACAQGIRLTSDRYPYTASSTDLDSVLPSWTFEAGNTALLKRLKTPGIRQKIRHELLKAHPEKEYWEAVSVSSVQTGHNKWMEGKNISQIAHRLRKSPSQTLIQILIDESLRAGGIFYSMDEGNLRRFLKLPFCMIGSDSAARSTGGPTHKGKVHPRGFGCFSRFMGKYIRDEGLMPFSSAIHKITMLPAKTFGIKKRGQIKKGFMADIVIFDEKAIADRATFDEPFKESSGIHHVIVNGVPVLLHGEMTGLPAGKVLRHGA